MADQCALGAAGTGCRSGVVRCAGCLQVAEMGGERRAARCVVAPAIAPFSNRRPQTHAPWHFLYFLPLPHGHGSFLPTLGNREPSSALWVLIGARMGALGAFSDARCCAKNATASVSRPVSMSRLAMRSEDALALSAQLCG